MQTGVEPAWTGFADPRLDHSPTARRNLADRTGIEPVSSRRQRDRLTRCVTTQEFGSWPALACQEEMHGAAGGTQTRILRDRSPALLQFSFDGGNWRARPDSNRHEPAS